MSLLWDTLLKPILLTLQPDIDEKILPLRGDFRAELLKKFAKEEVEMAFGGSLDISRMTAPRALPYTPVKCSTIQADREKNGFPPLASPQQVNRSTVGDVSGDGETAAGTSAAVAGVGVGNGQRGGEGGDAGSKVGTAGGESEKVAAGTGVKKGGNVVVVGKPGLSVDRLPDLRDLPVVHGGKKVGIPGKLARFLLANAVCGGAMSVFAGEGNEWGFRSGCATVVGAMLLMWGLGGWRGGGGDAEGGEDDEHGFAAGGGRDEEELEARMLHEKTGTYDWWGWGGFVASLSEACIDV